MKTQNTPCMSRDEYHFGECVLRCDTRELLKNGEVQPIERRSFDLILYLIKQDGRVVGKDELLEQVWGNRFVSDSVIAQSIMKVRKALGLSGKQGGPIKTIHRVGYRFVGEVRRVQRGSHESDVPGQSAQRLMWLPTEHAPEDHGLSWVRTGLLPVAIHVLQAHGVSAVPATDAQQWQSAQGPRQSLHRLLDVALAQGVATCLVASRLSVVEQHFRLDWELLLDGFQHANSVVGDSPAELALKAANEVALLCRLQPDELRRADPIRRLHQDLSEFIARDDTHHLFEKTSHLLASGARLDDCPLPVLAEYLFTLAQRTDAETPDWAVRLQHRARATKQAGFDAWARLCLACYHLYRQEPDLARTHLAGLHPALNAPELESLHAKAYLALAHIRCCLGETTQAHALWREAAQLTSARPHVGLSCRVMLQRAEILYLQRDIQAAGSAVDEALEAAQRHGQQDIVAYAKVYRGLVACAQGQVEAGRRHLEAASRCAEQSGCIRARLFALLHLGNCCARLGDRNALEQALARMGEPGLVLHPLGVAVGQWLQARLFLLDDLAAQALPNATLSLQKLADFGPWWAEESWLFVAQIGLRCGDRRAVTEVLNQLERSPQGRELPARRAAAMTVRAMLAYADGDVPAALEEIEQANSLARQSMLSPLLLFARVWLMLVSEHPQAIPLDTLAAAGDWVIHTREGRYLQAVLQDHHRWTWRPRQLPLLLSTGPGLGAPMLSDLCDDEPSRYADHLPLPV